MVILMVYDPRRRRKQSGPRKLEALPSKFTPEVLDQTARELKSGLLSTSIKQPWVTIGDDRQPGLRAIVRKSGAISFHVGYTIEGSRPFMIIGQYPDRETSTLEERRQAIEEARQLAKVVRGLADIGIDVQEGLHARLLRELQEEGLNWRPERKNAPESLFDQIISLLGEHGIKVSASVRSRVLAAL